MLLRQSTCACRSGGTPWPGRLCRIAWHRVDVRSEIVGTAYRRGWGLKTGLFGVAGALTFIFLFGGVEHISHRTFNASGVVSLLNIYVAAVVKDSIISFVPCIEQTVIIEFHLPMTVECLGDTDIGVEAAAHIDVFGLSVAEPRHRGFKPDVARKNQNIAPLHHRYGVVHASRCTAGVYLVELR